MKSSTARIFRIIIKNQNANICTYLVTVQLSPKLKRPILKTVGGDIRTIWVLLIQYCAK